MAVHALVFPLDAPADGALARCLDALARFETADGAPLRIALVVEGGAGAAATLTASADLADLLEDGSVQVVPSSGGAGKTLSAVLERCRAAAADAVLATDGAEWIEAAEALGMDVLRLGRGEWGLLPLRLAQRYFPGAPAALEAGVSAWLAARHDLELVNASAPVKGTLDVRAKRWVALRDERLEELDGVEVRLPVRIRVRLAGEDRPPELEPSDAPAEAVREAVEYVLSLQLHARIGLLGAALPAGATHVIEQNAAGRRRLVRRRFAAQ
jgi:hypothetical protein